jgi:pimeloyl-ACP methyl ester carboxylesterase
MQHIARSNPAKVFYTDFSACNAYARGEQAAGELQCPALFVLGKKDMMTPAKAATSLISQCPSAEVVQIDSCGHALMAEQPDQVLEALFRFGCACAK